MPYEVDHEVAVELKDAGATAKGKKVTIQATSLEHEISKVVLWSKRGRNAKPIDVLNKPPNTQVKFRDTHDTEIKTAHQVEIGQDIDTDDFPICVDVYEASTADGEAADYHRHGWFSKALRAVGAKGHPLKEPDDSWKKPFYPTLSEEKAPATGEAQGPEPYEK